MNIAIVQYIWIIFACYFVLLSSYKLHTMVSSTSQRAGAMRMSQVNLVDRLQAMPKPKPKDEAWRHNSLSKLLPEGLHQPVDKLDDSTLQALRPVLSRYVDQRCLKSHIVLVNGQYCKVLSDIGDLNGDLVTWVETSDKHDRIRKLPDSGEHPRDSFGSDYLVVMNEVLHCLVGSPERGKGGQGNAAAAVPAAYPSVVVAVGRGARLSMKETHLSFAAGPSSSPYPSLVLASTRVELQEGATMQHTLMQECTGSHVQVVSARLEGDRSRYDLTVVQSGANVSRVNVHVDMLGEASNCTLNGLTLAGPQQSLDLHTSISLNSTGCTVRQMQRNVIGSRGEAIFKGRIRIPAQAQGADADQLCRSIMLGRRARLQAMPTLEISADKVACSHGASVADLDENSLFYIAARGISRQMARKLLLQGFVLDALGDALMDKSDRERLLQRVDFLCTNSEPERMSGAKKMLSI